MERSCRRQVRSRRGAAVAPLWHHSVSIVQGDPRLARTGQLGGNQQSILIRGGKLSNPVLLFLHGGPGMPTMYLAHVFQRPLEEHFIAVQWDRLGAGKSFRKDIPPAKMRVSLEVADTVELIELLRKRFHKDKIYLAGFSYGSYLAMLVASRHHELLHAVIGIGQQVCSPEHTRQLQEAWIREHAVAAHAEEAIRQLDGKEPLDREKWLFEFGGELHHSKSWGRPSRHGSTGARVSPRRRLERTARAHLHPSQSQVRRHPGCAHGRGQLSASSCKFLHGPFRFHHAYSLCGGILPPSPIPTQGVGLV